MTKRVELKCGFSACDWHGGDYDARYLDQAILAYEGHVMREHIRIPEPRAEYWDDPV